MDGSTVANSTGKNNLSIKETAHFIHKSKG